MSMVGRVVYICEYSLLIDLHATGFTEDDHIDWSDDRPLASTTTTTTTTTTTASPPPREPSNWSCMYHCGLPNCKLLISNLLLMPQQAMCREGPDYIWNCLQSIPGHMCHILRSSSCPSGHIRSGFGVNTTTGRPDRCITLKECSYLYSISKHVDDLHQGVRFC